MIFKKDIETRKDVVSLGFKILRKHVGKDMELHNGDVYLGLSYGTKKTLIKTLNYGT